MIIRMTVHDNDFQDIMSCFVHNLYNGLTSISTDLYTKYTLEGPDSEAFDEYIQCSIRVNKIRELLNPNTTLVLSDDEKQLILQRVKAYSMIMLHITNRIKMQPIIFGTNLRLPSLDV